MQTEKTSALHNGSRNTFGGNIIRAVGYHSLKSSYPLGRSKALDLSFYRSLSLRNSAVLGHGGKFSLIGIFCRSSDAFPLNRLIRAFHISGHYRTVFINFHKSNPVLSVQFYAPHWRAGIVMTLDKYPSIFFIGRFPKNFSIFFVFFKKIFLEINIFQKLYCT